MTGKLRIIYGLYCISEPLPTVILTSFYEESEVELQTLHAHLLNSLLVTWWVPLRIPCVLVTFLCTICMKECLFIFLNQWMLEMYSFQEAPFQVFIACPEL